MAPYPSFRSHRMLSFFNTLQRMADTNRALRQSLQEKEQQLQQAQEKGNEAKRQAHALVEALRYALEDVSCQEFDGAEDLRGLAHAMPYLYSGVRTWGDAQISVIVNENRNNAQAIATKHGKSLPEDPQGAVLACLSLAAHLLNPEFQERHPLLAQVAQVRPAAKARVRKA